MDCFQYPVQVHVDPREGIHRVCRRRALGQSEGGEAHEVPPRDDDTCTGNGKRNKLSHFLVIVQLILTHDTM